MRPKASILADRVRDLGRRRGPVIPPPPFLLIIILSLLGCRREPSDPGPTHRIEKARAGAGTISGDLSHDLGAVLATGQTIRREFLLKNRGDAPVRLSEPIALTPCCSSVESLPAEIPPGGEGRVVVAFRVGHQTGPRRLAFQVATDQGRSPVVSLALSANVLSEWEVVPLPVNEKQVRLGETGTQRWRVTCRRLSGEGLALPERVECAAPLAAKFLGEVVLPPADDPRVAGLVASSRDFEVRLPGSTSGFQSGEVAFHWPDGLVRKFPVHWEVMPRIRVTPSGVVLGRSAGDEDRRLVLESDGRPFRILKIDGAAPGEGLALPTGPSSTHGLPVRFDRADGRAARDVRVTTDDPVQPFVDVSVLFLDTGGEIHP